MNKCKFLIFFLFFKLFILNTYALENKIILKIDNQIITSLDIQQEINYLKALNPTINKLDNKRILEIGKNSLIREKIKEKEILKYIEKIEIDQKYLNDLIKTRFLNLKLENRDQFKRYLKNFNLKINNIEKKITIEALWNQLIYSKFSSKVKINKKKLRKEISENKLFEVKKYLLSEIIFQVLNKKEFEEKLRIINLNIKENGFENTALYYSIADSASSGGKLGWIREDALNIKIQKKLNSLDVNDISDPILLPNGYLLLKIEDMKFTKKEINLEDEFKKILKFKTNEQLNQFSNIYFNKIKKDLTINEL